LARWRTCPQAILTNMSFRRPVVREVGEAEVAPFGVGPFAGPFAGVRHLPVPRLRLHHGRLHTSCIDQRKS